MDDVHRSDRLGASAGIVGSILAFVGTAIFFSKLPKVHDPLRDYVSFVRDDRSSIVAGVIVFLLGAGFLLWWLAWLRTTLTEGGNRTLADAAFGAGVAAIGVTFVALAPVSTVAWRGPGGLDRALVRFLVDFSQVTFGVVSAVPFAVLVATASVAIARRRTGPQWLAWLGGIAAILNGIPVFGLGARSGAMAPYGAIGLPGAIVFFAWVIATSVVLGLRDPVSRAAAARPDPGRGRAAQPV